MMQGSLATSMFSRVLFPQPEERTETENLNLRRSLRYSLRPDQKILGDQDLVIFDFETTGLDYDRDRIIEFGAIKVRGGEVVKEYWSLCSTSVLVSEQIQKMTGITPEMLESKPDFNECLPDFLAFMENSVLVAHNADFDMSFLKSACHRMGIDLEWPCICTLKLARELLPDLERKNLDTLAEHYGLTFEARHRSIGDAKVTLAVLHQMIENEGSYLRTWKEFQPFKA
jgi:DNA polymerase III epsilon subunit family exonuclease